MVEVEKEVEEEELEGEEEEVMEDGEEELEGIRRETPRERRQRRKQSSKDTLKQLCSYSGLSKICCTEAEKILRESLTLVG